MSLISLINHMCNNGFALLAINEKSRDRKNPFIGMAIIFFAYFYNLILNLLN